MENNLFISILILFIGLFICFLIYITDYSVFKKRIEKILDLDIKTNNHIKEVLNLSSEINKDVKNVCNLNDILIKKLIFLTDENTELRRIILSNNENDET